MENCLDPCGGCRPKCMKHKRESCSCEGDEYCDCMNSCNENRLCKCTSKSKCAGNECEKKIRCDVSCEKKKKSDLCFSPEKYECRVSCENETEHQTHVHEVQGSTCVSGKIPHTHRFASITGEKIKTCDSHIHKIDFKTNFAGHFHCFQGKTGPAIFVSEGKHIHFLESCTSVNDCHKHEFALSTLMN